MGTPTRWGQVTGNAAERYERDLVPGMFAPWAPLLTDLADLRPGDRALDIASGTGVVARLAAERVGTTGHVTGLDLNAGMLKVARALPPIVGAPLAWCQSDALALPLQSSSFDVVLCQQGVQQFPDRVAALREMHRVLAPSGRLAVGVWSRIEGSPGMAGLVAALERHVGLAAANNRRAPFALGDAAELHRLLTAADFRDIAIRTHTTTAHFPSPEHFAAAQIAATPLATLGTLTDQMREAVEHDIRAALHPYLTDQGLTLPMQAYLALARTP